MNQFSDHALQAAERFYQQGIDNGILRNINPKVLALTDKMFIQAVSNPKFLQEHDISIQEAFDTYFEQVNKSSTSVLNGYDDMKYQCIAYTAH